MSKKRIYKGKTDKSCTFCVLKIQHTVEEHDNLVGLEELKNDIKR